MITTALAISTVVMGAYAAFCTVRLFQRNFQIDEIHEELDCVRRQRDQHKDSHRDLIGTMGLVGARERCTDAKWRAEVEQRQTFEARYHAAVRALRTRQAVIDGLARERDGALKVAHEQRRNNEVFCKTAEEGYQRIRAEVKRLEEKAETLTDDRNDWQQSAESMRKAYRHLSDENIRTTKQRDRLAAQLKKLKARSK